MARKKHFWWHVVPDGWSSGAPIQAGILNTGKDIILILIDSEEPLADEPVVPENDSFVVERIIGQWQMRFDTPAVATNYFVHERVYVTDATAGSVAVRDLALYNEADTSFLYHQVTPLSASYINDTWGNWDAAGNVTDLPAQYRLGGPYFRDIKVGRRIQEGEALIYHWQLQGTVVPGDGEFSVKCWIRSLLRQG